MEENVHNDLPRFASVQYQKQINGLQIELDLADAKTRRRNWMLAVAGVFYAVLVGFLCVATMTNSVVIDFEKGSLPEQVNKAKAEVEKMKEFVKEKEAEIEDWKVINRLDRKDFEQHKKILLDDLKEAKKKAEEIKEKVENAVVPKSDLPSSYTTRLMALFTLGLIGLVSAIIVLSKRGFSVIGFTVAVVSLCVMIAAPVFDIAYFAPKARAVEAQAVVVSANAETESGKINPFDEWSISKKSSFIVEDLNLLPAGKVTRVCPSRYHLYGDHNQFYQVWVLESNAHNTYHNTYFVPESIGKALKKGDILPLPKEKPRAEY